MTAGPGPRVLLFAHHEAGRACLDALLTDGVPVVGLFTHRARDDEGWMARPEPLAREAGVPVYRPRSPNRPRWVQTARALRPELILSVMYRRLLGPDLLALPPRGALNLHPSLLPRYRGRCPVNWTLIHGEEKTGVTLHHMAAEADAGDIVAQRVLRIRPDDTALTLHRRLVPLFVALLRDTLPALSTGTAPRTPQNPAEATTFGGRGREDGAFEWTWPAPRIERLVRAVARPYPGAFADWEGQRLTVWAAEARPPGDAPLPPGSARREGDRLVFGTGDGLLLVNEWQLPNE